MNYTCYIVDDEFHAIDILTDFVTKTKGLTLVGSSDDPVKALAALSEGVSPDITFLDIDMPELSGLELAGLVNRLSTVIITTSYREYAVEAFEQQAVDYLLKPISYERFLKAVQRVRELHPKSRLQEAGSETCLFVNTGIKGQFSRIPVSEIRYIAGSLNYIEIHFKEQKLITYMSLTEVLNKLPPADFSRIHKSYIIQHDFISTVEYGQVRMTDKSVLPIGRVYRKAFHLSMNLPFGGSRYDQQT